MASKTTLTIILPLAGEPGSGARQYVPTELGLKDEAARDTLNRLLGGLIEERKTLADGTVIKSHEHTIAWLLEEVSSKVGGS